MKRRLFVSAALALAACGGEREVARTERPVTPPPAQPIGCYDPRVVDGDTLECGLEKIRLWGVDTPERGEYGYAEATRLLDAQVDDRRVDCQYRDTDDYGRTVALCRVNGDDVAEPLVAAGLAEDEPEFSGGYYAWLVPAWSLWSVGEVEHRRRYDRNRSYRPAATTPRPPLRPVTVTRGSSSSPSSVARPWPTKPVVASGSSSSSYSSAQPRAQSANASRAFNTDSGARSSSSSRSVTSYSSSYASPSRSSTTSATRSSSSTRR